MEERTEKAMMTAGELFAYRRWQEGKKRFPGVRKLSFRSTPNGWAVTPTDDKAKAGSVSEQQIALQRRLKEIQRTL